MKTHDDKQLFKMLADYDNNTLSAYNLEETCATLIIQKMMQKVENLRIIL